MRQLLLRYLSAIILHQLKSTLPVITLCFVTIVLTLQDSLWSAGNVVGGLFAAFFGLLFLTEGLRLSVMPLGKAVGEQLFTKLPLPLSVLALLFVGALVTYAEPAFSTLQILTPTINASDSTLLYLLNHGDSLLMPVIAVGVGFSTAIGVMRIRYQWHFRTIVVAVTVLHIAFFITALSIWGTEKAGPLMGLCFDVGIIITGPVAVPTLLSIGIGVSKSKSKNKNLPLNSEDIQKSKEVDINTTEKSPDSTTEELESQANEIMVGLGIVTICALLPVLTTQVLSIVLLGLAKVETSTTDSQSFIITSPNVVADIFNGSRAVAILIGGMAVLATLLKTGIPLVTANDVFSAWNIFGARKDRPKMNLIFFLSLLSTLIGMILINIGLDYGFSALGQQTGAMLPAAFTTLPSNINPNLDPNIPSPTPYYSTGLGLFFVFGCMFSIGFLATFAEPALLVFLKEIGIILSLLIVRKHRSNLSTSIENAFHATKKQVSQKSWILLSSIALGIGVGMVLGTAAIISSWPIIYLVLILRGVSAFFTLLWTLPTTMKRITLNEDDKAELELPIFIAWDSSGITTGPITVSFILSLSVGMASSVGMMNSQHGFGMVSVSSSAAVICVILIETYKRFKRRCQRSN